MGGCAKWGGDPPPGRRAVRLEGLFDPSALAATEQTPGSEQRAVDQGEDHRQKRDSVILRLQLNSLRR